MVEGHGRLLMSESTLSISEPRLVLSLFGARDQHLRQLRDEFGVSITHRDGELRVSGETDSVTKATQALEQLKSIVQREGTLDSEQVEKTIAGIIGDSVASSKTRLEVMNASKQIKPRTNGQQHYIDAIRKHDLTLAVGPAGTGKTYLAVASAVEALKQHSVKKIVLVRPAVEAGESLGFLPGDMQAKINPYLRPLLDALHEMVDYDQIKQLMAQDTIELLPLAYMRGRTLNEAFIILDEGQNTTVAQMKMFLTRMGEGSKIVVAGDVTQIDLPPHTRSGLIDAAARLKNIRGVCEIKLTRQDIVRHRLVNDIVKAYEKEKTQKSH